MTLETVRLVLAWSAIINLGILLTWFLFFTLAHDWIYRLHRKWFTISREAFDALHYGGMGLYKLGILLFTLTPYVALRIVLCP
jgi:uncharacterized membrane protein YjdF